jgi:hypothetical protein
MSGVPRIIRRNTFTIPERILCFDILPIAIGRARGIEKIIVRKKTSSDVTEPFNIA